MTNFMTYSFLTENLCFTFYLLTYSMMQSLSWEANLFAASQEIPRISRNPKVHYRTHMCPPPVPILCQPNPGHIPTPHLLEIRPNIIHPSNPRSPQWSLSLRFPPSPHAMPWWQGPTIWVFLPFTNNKRNHYAVFSSFQFTPSVVLTSFFGHSQQGFIEQKPIFSVKTDNN